MRLNRIFCTGPLSLGAAVPLPAAAANHVARVLRLREGAPLIVFDGSGNDYQAEIVGTGKGGEVTVRVHAQAPGSAESPLRITLVQGISRGERMDWTLQKATELGVDTIAPVLTARSVVRLDDKQADKKQAHWHGIVIGAREQSGRSRIPTVNTPSSLRDYLSTARQDRMRLVLSPTAPTSLPTLASLPAEVELLIGPEGGLDDAEIASAQRSGFTPVRLGPRILRTETAAVVALSVLQALWGDLR